MLPRLDFENPLEVLIVELNFAMEIEEDDWRAFFDDTAASADEDGMPESPAALDKGILLLALELPPAPPHADNMSAKVRHAMPTKERLKFLIALSKNAVGLSLAEFFLIKSMVRMLVESKVRTGRMFDSFFSDTFVTYKVR